MKKSLLTMALALLTIAANAQEKTTKWYDNIKFSGYGMLQYQGDDKYKSSIGENGQFIDEKNDVNTFNLRLARFILDGKIGDFDWRAQIQGTNVKGPGEPTVQLVDLYAEWRKYPEFKVRAGQFKRAFTFENPTHPITQGWYSYAMVVNNLSAFGDRTGEKSRCRATCYQMPTDVVCCTTKWVFTMVKELMRRIKTTARILLAVFG